MENPQQLPFAPHVTNHALVSVLNKGLLYDACERNSRVNLNYNEQVSSQVIGRGIFGPLLNTAAPPLQEIHNHNHTHPHTHAHTHAHIHNQNQDQDPSHEDPESVRKHQLEEESNHQIPNGPPGKKPRLTNGYEHGHGNANGSGGAERTNGNHVYEATPVPMEIDGDQDADGHAYPSPEQLPSPLVITNGPERGTQIEKVTELGTETLYLDLLDDSPTSKSTILLHCEWNPKHPSILAAAGTDALARMWNLAHTVTDGTNGTHPQSSGIISTHPACTSLLDPNSPPSTLVNSMSWASDGSAIIVASEQINGSAKIDAWTVDGRRVHTSAGMEAPIICLKWNFANTLFLSISPLTNPETETKGTIIIVTSMTGPRTSQFVLPQHNLADQELDAVWTSDEDFIVCGGDMLMSYHFADGAITPTRKFETREDHALSKITFDLASNLLATASENGVIDIWDQEGHCRSFNAHTGLITSLIWQPLPNSTTLSEESERLLASSSEDGAISIWNARSSDNKQKCSMTIGPSSVLALSFTPDGAFIAGATSDRVLIWKVEDTHMPRASWARPIGNGWQTPQSNDSVGEEDEHKLSWDANGQRLAYGCNSVLAVINFSR
ncbi:hypothetical protein ACMFMG_005803 [Clarireedia jacksonii]